MKAPTRIWIPAEEAIPGVEYHGYKSANESPTMYHMCSVRYKGNGVGWIFDAPKHEEKNIIQLERYTTFQEQEDWYKEHFDIKDSATFLNLNGLFNDLYDTCGAAHEMWNAWVCCDFHELNANLKENEMMLVGIAPAPYDWNMGEECRAYVIEDVETHDLYWCHGSKAWVDVMRDQMEECWNELGG